MVGVLAAMHSTGWAANAVVSRPVADMHSSGSDETDVVSQAIYGTNVEILEERKNWARVRTPDGYAGWIHRPALAKTERRYADSGSFVEVVSLFANVYREASATKHKPVMTLPFETRLEVGDLTPEKRWVEVRLIGGQKGWVQAGDVNTSPQRMSIAETIELSRMFLGLPYLWGGTSTFGYDCSGFTQMLCRRRGIALPRDAHQQAAWSGVSEVAKSALRAGDLLYFGASPEKITHTGMYIGNGEFINATLHERPVVQICKLSDPYWTKIFVAARRVK
jgi:cell wall-associated NlpC family hydrolase